MRILFGIAIVALVAFTAWSVEPTVGKTPSTDFHRSPRHDGQYHQSTASSLQRLQHYFLTDCAVGSSIFGFTGPSPASPGRFLLPADQGAVYIGDIHRSGLHPL